MPRVQVLTEIPGCSPETLLTEHVPSEMLADDHYADQLVERMGWALVDAEKLERAMHDRHGCFARDAVDDRLVVER